MDARLRAALRRYGQDPGDADAAQALAAEAFRAFSAQVTDEERPPTARVTSRGANQVVLEVSDGSRVLVSYETPVAAVIMGTGLMAGRPVGHWRTGGESRTTTKHQRTFLGPRYADAEVVSREQIASLM